MRLGDLTDGSVVISTFIDVHGRCNASFKLHVDGIKQAFKPILNIKIKILNIKMFELTLTLTVRGRVKVSSHI